MRLPSLSELVASSGKLATIPSTIVDLLRILHDPTTAAGEVQKVLERDPAMTANVLKIANSAFYGARRQITSVRDALVMLGNRRTATLAFATSMAPVLRRDLLGYGLSREQFWNHSLLTAAAAARVVTVSGNADAQCEAFTAGLVHDLGMLVLDPVLGAAKLVIKGEGSPFGLSGVERETLGYDHSMAGASLAESWGFPDVLYHAIEHHHDPLPFKEGEWSHHWPVLQAVAAGNIIAQAVDEDLEVECVEDHEACLAQLGLPAGLAEDLRLDLTQNLGEICEAATALAPARV